MPARIRFSRSSVKAAHTYQFFDIGGNVTETGVFTNLNSTLGIVDLHPSTGPDHLARYDILSETMRVNWNVTRPPDLTGAATYQTTQ